MTKAPKKKRCYWQPLSASYIISNYKLTSWKVLLPLLGWILLLSASLLMVDNLMPVKWLMSDSTDIIEFFIFLPTFIIGVLLLFWVGFEWAFIPVFISTFAVAFNSGISIIWSIIFGFSFIFSLALYGLAYQSLRMPYDLRGFKSVAFYISVSFVASLASSLGAFIWSLSHNLSAYQTSEMWKSWWTGIFFQSILIVGPLLFFFTPYVERIKRKHYKIKASAEVSLSWIYGTVISITIALLIFIFAGRWLGKYRVHEAISNLPIATQSNINGALNTFEIIIWLSMGLILITGFISIYLISHWNKDLQAKVDERTLQLEESEQELQKSLQEKKLMLKETHHRVKNNLSQVQALLQLQMMKVDNEEYRQLLNDSCSRIQAMSLIHKSLYNTEHYTSISLESYFQRLCTIIHESFSLKESNIDLEFDLTDYALNAKQAVPLGLMVSEVLINAHKHAFVGREKGVITIRLTRTNNGNLLLEIADDGVGFSKEAARKKNSLGMELIERLADQLDGKLTIRSDSNGTHLSLQFKPES